MIVLIDVGTRLLMRTLHFCRCDQSYTRLMTRLTAHNVMMAHTSHHAEEPIQTMVMPAQQESEGKGTQVGAEVVSFFVD